MRIWIVPELQRRRMLPVHNNSGYLTIAGLNFRYGQP